MKKLVLHSVCTNFAVENVIDMFDIVFDDVYRELLPNLRVVAVTAAMASLPSWLTIKVSISPREKVMRCCKIMGRLSCHRRR